MTLQNCQCGKRFGTYRTAIHSFGRLGCSACWIQNLVKNIKKMNLNFIYKGDSVRTLTGLCSSRRLPLLETEEVVDVEMLDLLFLWDSARASISSWLRRCNERKSTKYCSFSPAFFSRSARSISKSLRYISTCVFKCAISSTFCIFFALRSLTSARVAFSNSSAQVKLTFKQSISSIYVFFYERVTIISTNSCNKKGAH